MPIRWSISIGQYLQFSGSFIWLLGIIGYYHYVKLTGTNEDIIVYLLRNEISLFTTLIVVVNLMLLRLIIGNLWTINFRILIHVYALKICLLM